MSDLAIWDIAEDGTLTGIPVPYTLISGIDEVVQNFLIELLTPRGSASSDTGLGTSFIPLIAELGIQPLSVQHAFGVAELEIRGKSLGQSTYPQSQQYMRADLVSIDIQSGYTALEIVVYNKLEESKSVILRIVGGS